MATMTNIEVKIVFGKEEERKRRKRKTKAGTRKKKRTAEMGFDILIHEHVSTEHIYRKWKNSILNIPSHITSIHLYFVDGIFTQRADTFDENMVLDTNYESDLAIWPYFKSVLNTLPKK